MLIDCSDFLRKEFPNLPEKDYSKAFAKFSYGSTTHWEYEDMAAISHELIRSDGHNPNTIRNYMLEDGAGKFLDDYKPRIFYRHLDGSGYCKPFEKSKKFLLEQKKFDRWVMCQSSIKIVKNTRKGTIDITDQYVVKVHQTPVNVQEIIKFRDSTTNWYWRKHAEMLLLRVKEGILITQYIQSKTNRYQAIGWSLQNAPKSLKEAALTGCYSYDSSASQWNILHQRLVLKVPSVTMMIEGKQFMRERIARELECSIAEAKFVTTASLFGISTSYRLGNGRTIGESHYVRQIHQDLEEIAQEIQNLAASRSRTGNSNLTPKSGIGTFGDTIAPEIWKRLGWGRKKLAYMLQAEEVKVLESLIEAFDDDIVFLHHDSITTTRRMDPDELSRVVYEKTGYKLSFEETIH